MNTPIKRRRLLGALLASPAAVPALSVLGACATATPPEKTLSPSIPPSLRLPAHEAEGARLDALFAQMLQTELQHTPQTATRLGLDTGANAALRFQLDDRSADGRERFVQAQIASVQQLEALEHRQLSGVAACNIDTVLYQRKAMLEGARRFRYGTVGDSEPYVLSPLTGAYQSVPDFLQHSHPIDNAEDAHAFLSRLGDFAKSLDQECERAQADAASGIAPPDFVIDSTLLQLKALRAEAATSTWLHSLTQRTAAKGIAGDWGTHALSLVENHLNPALDRQIALLQGWRAHATPDAGVWRLPDGEAYYQQAILLQTTTGASADEVHRMGLAQVDALLGEIDGILRTQGMGSGTVGQRLAAMGRDDRFIYPDTDAGRAQLLGELRAKVQRVQEKLPQYFEHLPRARLDIRRVPPGIEAGAPRGYYQAGTPDGARPGAFYVNLRDTAEWTRFYAPTFAFHEGIPGHHLQGALAQQANGVAMLRQTMWFAGYGEGWALYAEQLADEMGLYDDDPFGRVGYLQSMLFRAARLVVDTGLHARRWGRDQAVRYLVDTLGESRSRMAAEVARYCVVPGQALSYKIGHTRWLALREAARRQLGPRFDLRRFHSVGLMSGAVPLDVLDQRMARWIGEQASAAHAAG